MAGDAETTLGKLLKFDRASMNQLPRTFIFGVGFDFSDLHHLFDAHGVVYLAVAELQGVGADPCEVGAFQGEGF